MFSLARTRYRDFTLFAFTTFTAPPYDLLLLRLKSRSYSKKMSEISHDFSDFSLQVSESAVEVSDFRTASFHFSMPILLF